jgi:hypothetical protein
VAAPLAVIAGALANKPFNGGEAWVRLSWVRGMARLGWRVAFLEEIDAATCVDETGRSALPEASVNRRWFDDVVRAFGLDDRSTLWCQNRSVTGLCERDLRDLLRDADLLVNISGNVTAPELLDVCCRRVYVDIDPGYTQLWSATGLAAGRLESHHVHVTIGSNIGTDACPIPTNGLHWHHVLPPVVLEDWPAFPAASCGQPVCETGIASADTTRFTTVATWRGPYGSIDCGGRTLGSKVHQFRAFASLPSRASGCFEMALAIDRSEHADRNLLAAQGWSVVDPARAAGSVDAFRRYVQGSAAEFSVAQEMYVATDSGWFSDRSTRYLASGRPVLVQDTGFSRTLPVGTGLMTFTTMDEAVAGARSIMEGYPTHAAAARRLAEEYFDSDRVLAGFLERVGLP